jgi:hypothetical protein
MADLHQLLEEIRQAHEDIISAHTSFDRLLLDLPDVNDAENDALPNYVEYTQGVHEQMSHAIDAGHVVLMTLESMQDSHNIMSLMNGMNDLQNRVIALRDSLSEAMNANDYSFMHQQLRNAFTVSEDIEQRWNDFLEEAEQEIDAQMGGRRKKKRTLRKHRKQTRSLRKRRTYRRKTRRNRKNLS